MAKKVTKKKVKQVGVPVIHRGTKKKAKKKIKGQPKPRIIKTATPTKKKTKKKAAVKYVTVVAPDLELKRRLTEKVMNVCTAWNGFEGTGVGKDIEDGSQFGYTRSEQVFKKYAELCKAEGLWWRPVNKEWKIGYRAVWVNATYELVDVATGFSVEFSGMGQGNNGVWAVNSAQTVALKQALLELFMAYWTEPEDIRREKVDPFATFMKMETVEDAKALMGYMGDFFGGKLQEIERLQKGGKK